MSNTEIPAENGRSVSRLGVGTLLGVSTLTIMAGATISPALPAMQSAFSATPNAEVLVQLVLTMPALFIAVGAPITGAVVDRLGRTKLLFFSTILYGVSGGAGFVLDSLYLILVSRALLGIAVAGVMVASTTLIADYFDGERRDTVMGWQGAFITAGGVVFLTLGGVLADIEWRVPFLIYISAFGLLPLILLTLNEPEVNRSDERSVTDLDAARALIKTLPIRTLGVIYTVALIGMVVFYLIPVQLPFYLTSVTAATGTLIGIGIAISNVSGGITSSQFDQFRKQFNHHAIVGIVFGLIGIGYVIIGTSQSYLVIVIGLFVVGAGLGLLIPNLNVWATNAVDGQYRGRALGGITSMIFLGQFISPLMTRPIIDAIGIGATFVIVGFGVLVVAGLFVFASLRQGQSPGVRS